MCLTIDFHSAFWPHDLRGDMADQVCIDQQLIGEICEQPRDGGRRLLNATQKSVPLTKRHPRQYHGDNYPKGTNRRNSGHDSRGG